MGNETFVRLTRIEASVKDVFAWHKRPGAFERLTPPWVRVDVIEHPNGITSGSRVVLRLHKGPLSFPWLLEHVDYEEDRQFKDIQVTGPFAFWEHTHNFEPDGAACYMQDRVEYRLPFGALGRSLAEKYVRRELGRLFVYRHRIITHDIAVHRAYGPVKPRRILVSGASGLIGSALVPFLSAGGHHVARLTRDGERSATAIPWNPADGDIDREALEGYDVFIHLAGENIMGGRWTAARKQAILESRVKGTRLLAETIAQLKDPPSVFLGASAIGAYGNRGSELLDEESRTGTGFLADVCKHWEKTARPAAEKGVRVASLRFGVVLSPSGGALGTMLPAFRVGVGGPIGTGWQFMSWISIDDAIEAILHCMLTDSLSGPVNVVSPYVATNRDFARTLGLVLNAPASFRVPAWVVRLAFGELADQTVLSSARVQPQKLTDTGFVFHFPDLEGALRHVLGRH